MAARQIKRRGPGVRAVHRPAYKQFCRLLREWRTAAGLTQRQLAAKLKKPSSFVHKCETAERRIDALEFVAWWEATGIDPAVGIKQVGR